MDALLCFRQERTYMRRPTESVTLLSRPLLPLIHSSRSACFMKVLKSCVWVSQAPIAHSAI